MVSSGGQLLGQLHVRRGVVLRLALRKCWLREEVWEILTPAKIRDFGLDYLLHASSETHGHDANGVMSQVDGVVGAVVVQAYTATNIAQIHLSEKKEY